MNTRILNRAGKLPEDGFYQFEAPGEHINHAAMVVQVVDAKAIDAIVNQFTDESKADNFPGIRIDKDHLSQAITNPTESLGWISQLRNRGGIPEARIDWTALGQPLVDAKLGQPPVYKFFSTEYAPEQCEKIGTRIVNRKTYTVVRPLRLIGLSLTNDPNNKGQRPISNRSGDADAGKHQPDSTMKNIMNLLGLAEDAPEASAVTEIQKIKTRVTSAEAERDALKRENSELKNAQVDTDLEAFKGVIANRDAVKAMLLSNRCGTLELLKGLRVSVSEDPKRITNRALAKSPEQDVASGRDAAERAAGAKISNRAAELRQANPKLSRSQAFAKAEAEQVSA